jgi:hypothetical protein
VIPSPRDDEQVSLRDLVARAIDDIKNYLRAEIALVRARVSTAGGKAGPALAFLILAIVIAQSALTILFAAVGALLALWIGWPGGLAVAALLALAVSGWLAWRAYRKVTRLFG